MYARHDDAFDTQPAAPAGLRRRLVDWALALQRDRIELRAEAALASMDAHLLRDIGAERGDLARLVREGRG